MKYVDDTINASLKKIKVLYPEFGEPTVSYLTYSRYKKLPLPICKIGSNTDVPIHMNAGLTLGLRQYESPWNCNCVFFVLVMSVSNDENEYYLIAPKGQAWKIHTWLRHMPAKLEKIRDMVLDPVILEKIKKNTLDFYTNRKIYLRHKVKLTRGILLNGNPGNGKSMICSWLQSNFTALGYQSSIMNSNALKNALQQNNINNYMKGRLCIFDDIDISFLNRKSGGDMACSLLSSLDDGSSVNKVSIRIFTTNESIEALDPAFKRPGRIDEVITLQNPNEALRLRYFNEIFSPDVAKLFQVSDFLKHSSGMTFAELDELRGRATIGWIEGNTINLKDCCEEILTKKAKSKESVGFK